MRHVLAMVGWAALISGCSGSVQLRTEAATTPAPPTPVAVAPTAPQAGLPETFVEEIEFDSARAQIRDGSKKTLDDLAAKLLADPSIQRVDIEGHCDSRGTPERNLDLSTRRAREVRLYLIKKGVDPSRLVARGFGEERPISDNWTAEGRQYNRRVEFVVYRQSARVDTGG